VILPSHVQFPPTCLQGQPVSRWRERGCLVFTVHPVPALPGPALLNCLLLSFLLGPSTITEQKHKWSQTPLFSHFKTPVFKANGCYFDHLSASNQSTSLGARSGCRWRELWPGFFFELDVPLL